MACYQREGSHKKAKGPSSAIRSNKGRLVQERLLPPIPKLFGPRESRLCDERSPWRDLRKPLWVTIVSTQTDPSRVLLAHHAEGCPNLCQNLWQVLKVQQRHQTAIRRVDHDDSPVAIYSVGIRHHRINPNSGAIAEVPYSRHRLLHKVGRSWSSGNHYKECAMLRLEAHHLQV